MSTTDQAAGGDLAALREWIGEQIARAKGEADMCAQRPGSVGMREAVARGRALTEVRDRLAAAPASDRDGTS